jgi:hypothetical protein
MNNKREALEYARDEALDSFDFLKVKNVMEHIQWEWVRLDWTAAEEFAVPSIYRIIREAYDLSQKAIDEMIKKEEDTASIGSGGFEIQLEYDGDSAFFFIDFVLESTEGFSDPIRLKGDK